MTIRARIPGQLPSRRRARLPRPASHRARNALIVLALVAIVVSGVLVGVELTHRAAAQRAATEDACAWYYRRYSTEWQNCVDTP